MKTLVQVRGLLGGDISATEPKPYRMAKAVYQSCMNKELIERRGLEPVKAVLKRLGGWPLLEGAGWDGAGFRWYEQMYRHRELGFSVDYFYDFSVSTDLKVRDLSTIFGEGPSPSKASSLLRAP